MKSLRGVEPQMLSGGQQSSSSTTTTTTTTTSSRPNLLLISDPSSRQLLMSQRDCLADYTRRTCQAVRRIPSSRTNGSAGSTTAAVVSPLMADDPIVRESSTTRGFSPSTGLSFSSEEGTIRPGSVQAFLSPSILLDQPRRDGSFGVESVSLSDLGDNMSNVDELCNRFHMLLTGGKGNNPTPSPLSCVPANIPVLSSSVRRHRNDDVAYDGPDTESFNVAAVEAAMGPLLRLHSPSSSSSAAAAAAPSPSMMFSPSSVPSSRAGSNTSSAINNAAAASIPPSLYYQALWTSTIRAAATTSSATSVSSGRVITDGIIDAMDRPTTTNDDDDDDDILTRLESAATPRTSGTNLDSILETTTMNPNDYPSAVTERRYDQPSSTTTTSTLLEEEEKDTSTSPSTPPMMLEVAPSTYLPMKNVNETWKAISDGRVVITYCIVCEDELTCVDDLSYVVCSDCWTINPVDQSSCTISQWTNPSKNSPINISDNVDDDDDDDDDVGDKSNSNKKEQQYVGLGVKNRDIAAWMEDGCRESFALK